MRRSQNCIRKQNTFCGTRVTVPLLKFYEKKTASLRNISLKSDNRLLSYGRNTIFKTAAVRHL